MTCTPKQLEDARRWRAVNKDTPRYKYTTAKNRARRRGIPFLLTFEEWWHIWKTSGHWAEIGLQRGQYVMSRPGDQGPYTVGNVVICRTEENVVEAKIGKPRSEQTRARISATSIGKVMSDQARKRMSKAKVGGKRYYRPDGTWTWRYP